MKILAPVSSLSEGKRLISEGAQELYCGLQPGQWNIKYGDGLWLNRRGPGQANMTKIEDLAELVAYSHKHNVKVFLTLNQSIYLEAFYNDIIQLVQEINQQGGVDAIIIGDPGLMKIIKQKVPDIMIHASSLAAILNSATAGFFKTLGAERIIFPRYIKLKDMSNIRQTLGSDIEYEAFVLNDGCIFEEAYCFANHGFGGAICHNPRWNYKLNNSNGKLEQKDIDSFSEHLVNYREWIYTGIKNMGGTSSPKGHPVGMCGLCALPELKAMGINSLKIVGREAPLQKKLASVSLLKKCLEYLDAEENPEKFKQNIQKLRSIPKICESNYMCYYRD